MLSSFRTSKLSGIFSFLKIFDHRKPILKHSDLISFQKSFNLKLKQYIETKALDYNRLTNEYIPNQALEYSISMINGKGKRIRPYLCFLAYSTEGGLNYDYVFNTGVGLEIFHAFALIHDDIIDGAMERHGMMTVHEYVKTIITNKNKNKMAESIALLVGDLLFSWANEIIGKTANTKVQNIYYKMNEETVAGQMIDVALMLQPKVNSKTLFRKNELKTARYSFVNPMLIGATLANPVSPHEEFYTKLGLLLGQAFQIQDDLLDIVGDPKVTGKSTMLDIQDGQHTLITQYVLEHGNPRDQEILTSLFGKHVDEASHKVLTRLFSTSGAVVNANREVSKLISESIALIGTSDLKQTDKDKWIEFITLLNNRKS